MRMQMPNATEPSRRLPLYALLAANTISRTGNALAGVAIPWFVLETTSSAARTGITAAFGMLPVVLAAFFGGAVVDRFGFKRSSIVADLASAVAVVLIPLLHLTTGLAFWQLLVLVFLGALLDTPGNTARGALFPDLAKLGGLQLERANAMHEIASDGAMLAGPPLAGLLIALWGTDYVLLLNAATFVISALLIWLLVPGTQAAPEGEPSEPSHYLRDVADGLRFIQRERTIFALVGSTALVNFVVAPLLGVVLPVYAQQVFGTPVSLGLMLAAFFSASTAGGVVFGMIGHRFPRRMTYLAGLLSFAGAVVLLAFLPPLPIILTVLLLGGFVNGPVGPLFMTILQERTPAALRGRVFGTVTAVEIVMGPLGLLVTGSLIELVDIRIVLAGIAAWFLATIIALAAAKVDFGEVVSS